MVRLNQLERGLAQPTQARWRGWGLHVTERVFRTHTRLVQLKPCDRSALPLSSARSALALSLNLRRLALGISVRTRSKMAGESLQRRFQATLTVTLDRLVDGAEGNSVLVRVLLFFIVGFQFVAIGAGAGVDSMSIFLGDVTRSIG